MVRRILNALQREVRGLHEAAYLLGVFALASQVLALVRDRLLTGKFGAGETLDIYYAAFRIPDFIFVTVASLVSLSVLIPFLTDKINSSNEEGRKFISGVFSVFSIGIIVVSAIVFVFTPQLIKIILPGFVQDGLNIDLVLLTRILLLQPILLGFSSLFASIVHVHQKFILYAVSPLLYNIGIIFGVLVLYKPFGIAGLGYGVVLGAFMHMFLQVPFIIKSGFFPRFSFVKEHFKVIKEIIVLSLPRTLALSANQLSLIVLVGLASLMVTGSIAVFNLSLNLQSIPLVIIGASYSVAAFPTLVKLFSRGDREKFFVHITTAARHIIFWSFPAIALFIILRAQIVRVILGSGEFSWTDTRLTAAALALFAVSLVAQSLVLLFVRGYYAAGKTMKPLIINVFSSILVVVFSFLLLKLFEISALWRYFVESLLRVEDISGTSVLMLPLGYSLALLINATLFWIAFQKDFKRFSKALSNTFFESFAAAITIAFISHRMLNLLDNVFDINTFLGIFAQGLISGIIGVLFGIVMLKVLKNKELEEVWLSLHRKFWKTKVISSE